MRLDLRFRKPLDREQRTRVLLALAGLGKSRSARFSEGGHAVVLIGEAMGVARLREALAEQGLEPLAVSSSLPDAESALLDPSKAEQAATTERLRPMGR